MVALGARIELRNATGARSVHAEDFFTGLFTTAIEPGELLTTIEIPAADNHNPARRGWAFQEFSRRHGDFALAGAAAVVDLDTRGRCSNVRVVLFSLGDRPMLASHAANALIGHAPTADSIRSAADAAATSDASTAADKLNGVSMPAASRLARASASERRS